MIFWSINNQLLMYLGGKMSNLIAKILTDKSARNSADLSDFAVKNISAEPWM